jgi:hypothetical protein
MTFALPRMPDPTGVTSVAELARRFYTYANDVYDFLRLIPTIEFKTFTTQGQFPIYVQTIAPRVKDGGVIRTQTYETKNSANTIEHTGVAWRRSDDPNQPGIIIDRLEGLTRDTLYTVTLVIFGERGGR